MTIRPQDVTTEHLGLMLHNLLIDIRLGALCDTLDAKEIARVTDLAELIPLQLIHRDDDYMRMIIAGVEDLAKDSFSGRRMASVLAMSRDEVIRTLVPSHGQTLATA